MSAVTGGATSAEDDSCVMRTEDDDAAEWQRWAAQVTAAQRGQNTQRLTGDVIWQRPAM